jgi:hypothetical protein
MFDNFEVRHFEHFEKINNLTFGNFTFEKLNFDIISLYPQKFVSNNLKNKYNS